MSKTVVIGGGVIGLLSAVQLRRRGQNVVLIDKGEFKRGSSSGNAGWVTPSLSAPVPGPGVIRDSIRWMLQPAGPLYVKPSAMPKLSPWLFSFWRHCSKKAHAHGLEALSQFNSTTFKDFDDLQKLGLHFEEHKQGLMYVFLDQESVPSAIQELEESSRHAPIHWEVLSPYQAQEREPVLRAEIAGAINISSDRHIRPESLLDAAFRWLHNEGVAFHPNTEVHDFIFDGRRITGLKTSSGDFEAEQVLIAAGAESSELCAKAGLRLPMQAGKGYSLTMDLEQAPIGRSVYLSESRVALSPFKGALRIAGTMELSGVNLELREARIEAMLKNARRYLRFLGDGPVSEKWVGMRPMLPDGLPAIGQIPTMENLFIASGHAMLGVTLGPTTATAIAELMVNKKSPYDLSSFRPDRFI